MSQDTEAEKEESIRFDEVSQEQKPTPQHRTVQYVQETVSFLSNGRRVLHQQRNLTQNIIWNSSIDTTQQRNATR
jgi:D-hexose-6-phosphate mutarotase